MVKLRLTLACEDAPLKRPIIDRAVSPDGIDLTITVAHSSEIFWRQLSRAEFDVSEMSLSSFLILLAHGDRRFVGLPVFPSRRFFHTNCYVRTDRGIDRVEDLRGKRIGIPEYQVTSMVWTRGALEHEFGLSPHEVEWWVERTPDRSHGGVTGFEPPRGLRVTAIPPARSIGAMMATGELDATFSYIVSVNAVDRSDIDLSHHDQVKSLFHDPAAEGARYFQKTGIHPVNHLVVVRRSILERHPWVAINLYKLFAESRSRVLADAQAQMSVYFDLGVLREPGRKAVATRVLPYGVSDNLRLLETIAHYSHEQGLTQRAVDVAEMFAPSTASL